MQATRLERPLRNRHGSGVRVALLAGVYLSSLDGFYELRAYDSHLEARFLVPWVSSRIDWSDRAQVDGRPAFKNQLRLHLVRVAEHRLVSATWNRQGVAAAADEIRRRLRREVLWRSEDSCEWTG